LCFHGLYSHGGVTWAIFPDMERGSQVPGGSFEVNAIYLHPLHHSHFKRCARRACFRGDLSPGRLPPRLEKYKIKGEVGCRTRVDRRTLHCRGAGGGIPSQDAPKMLPECSLNALGGSILTCVMGGGGPPLVLFFAPDVKKPLQKSQSPTIDPDSGGHFRALRITSTVQICRFGVALAQNDPKIDRFPPWKRF